jgi:hypothetical protein
MIVLGKRIGLPFEREPAAANAVAIAPDQRAEIRAVGEVAVEVVIPQDDVGKVAAFVRHDEFLQNTTVSHDPGPGAPGIMECIDLHRCAVRHRAEGSFRDGCQ